MIIIENISDESQKLGNLARVLAPGKEAIFKYDQAAAYGLGWMKKMKALAKKGIFKITEKEDVRPRALVVLKPDVAPPVSNPEASKATPLKAPETVTRLAASKKESKTSVEGESTTTKKRAKRKSRNSKSENKS